MGSIDRRIGALERQFAADSAARGPQEPSEVITHLRAILREFAMLKASCAPGLRGGVPIEPENIPRRILGPGYTHDELLRLAVERTVEAGSTPAERADVYLKFMRDVGNRHGKDPDAIVEWERGGQRET
jgi:hypothetical protein